jgi:hypothetical protein
VTDDLTPFGLGWLPSPDDDRDWGVDALYAATGTAVPDALPASYHVPAPQYPVVDQGSSPMCVAYSAAPPRPGPTRSRPPWRSRSGRPCASRRSGPP